MMGTLAVLPSGRPAVSIGVFSATTIGVCSATTVGVRVLNFMPQDKSHIAE